MTTGTRRSWREEIRQDRLISAQIDRDREAARTQAWITERRALTQLWQERKRARSAARLQARDRRAARRTARLAWVHAHVLDLLFVPVIVVPAVLAWTAMAACGSELYGPVGLMLPAFSEGAMWAFAIATTWTTRHYPDRPTWHLRLGTGVFAAVAAVLNFAHGMTAPPVGPGPHGVGVGVVMALVSVAGVIAHQFITAGPRRSRADRHQARLVRTAGRRELAVRRAAVRHAIAVVDEHGHAHLIYQPGTVTLGRRHLRTRLSRVRTAESVREPRTDDAAPDRTDRTDAGEATGQTAGGQPLPGGEVDRAAIVADLVEQIRDAIEAGERWQPDYPALMARTGFRRSWCEKAVRDARTAVFDAASGAPAIRTGEPDSGARTDPDSGARTDTPGPHGPDRTGRPVLHAVGSPSP